MAGSSFPGLPITATVEGGRGHPAAEEADAGAPPLHPGRRSPPSATPAPPALPRVSALRKGARSDQGERNLDANLIAFSEGSKHMKSLNLVESSRLNDHSIGPVTGNVHLHGVNANPGQGGQEGISGAGGGGGGAGGSGGGAGGGDGAAGGGDGAAGGGGARGGEGGAGGRGGAEGAGGGAGGGDGAAAAAGGGGVAGGAGGGAGGGDGAAAAAGGGGVAGGGEGGAGGGDGAAAGGGGAGGGEGGTGGGDGGEGGSGSNSGPDWQTEILVCRCMECQLMIAGWGCRCLERFLCTECRNELQGRPGILCPNCNSEVQHDIDFEIEHQNEVMTITTHPPPQLPPGADTAQAQHGLPEGQRHPGPPWQYVQHIQAPAGSLMVAFDAFLYASDGAFLIHVYRQ